MALRVTLPVKSALETYLEELSHAWASEDWKFLYGNPGEKC